MGVMYIRTCEPPRISRLRNLLNNTGNAPSVDSAGLVPIKSCGSPRPYRSSSVCLQGRSQPDNALHRLSSIVAQASNTAHQPHLNGIAVNAARAKSGPKEPASASGAAAAVATSLPANTAPAKKETTVRLAS